MAKSITTTVRGLGKLDVNSPNYTTDAAAPASLHNANADIIEAALGGAVYAVDGAITQKEGAVVITKASAAALTLAAPAAGSPSAGGDDFKVLRVVGTTAFAHTVTTPANKINGNKHIETYANVGDSITLLAYNGVWYLVSGTATLT